MHTHTRILFLSKKKKKKKKKDFKIAVIALQFAFFPHSTILLWIAFQINIFW